MTEVRRWAERVLAALTVGFHLWLLFEGLLSNLVSRPIHMALAVPWVLLLAPAANRFALWSGRILGIGAIAGALWIVWNYRLLDEQYGMLVGGFQYGLAILLILAVLEMARRVVRLALPTVAVLALLYGLFGQYIPGEFGHPGIPWASLLGNLTIAEAGIWGPLTGVSVNIVAIFVILGAVLSAGEAGTGFMALAMRIAGRLRGGAAKVAVLASALFGSLSGSASANVASTGAVTLPMMKRLGYPPALAAAVEAVASTGGQIMPPLMGAGAFVMVELLQIPYSRVMTAALLPALLFFFACWVGIDLAARRHRLVAIGREDLPSTDLLLRTVPFFLLPLGLLLWLLLGRGVTAQLAAAWAVFLAFALLLTDRRLRFEPAAVLGRLERAIHDAARQIAAIASIIICAGLVIGVLNLTGLGVKVTSVILGLSGGRLLPALLLTALACLLLGMEVPTTAAYVIAVSVAGPALQQLGLEGLMAHLFVFWYALLSTITPPVCGTVFIASGMLGAPWLATAFHAMRLGLGLYLVPLGFVVEPALIDPLAAPGAALLAFVKIGTVLAALAWALGELRARPVTGGLVAGLALLLLALPLGALSPF